MSLVYRKANLSEIPTLVMFRKQQLIDEGQQPNFDADNTFTDYFTKCFDNDSLVQYVAIDGTKIAATGGVHFYSCPPSYRNPTGKIAYIAGMYTLPCFRGRGIATIILKHLIEEARRRNYNVVRLHASPQGRPVYEKMGFIHANGFMTLHLPGE